MKKLIVYSLIICLLIVSCNVVFVNKSFVKAADKISNPVYDAEKDYAEWDCIYFGNYPQDTADKEDKQPIKWRVLSVNGNDVMLISDKKLFGSEFINRMGDMGVWSSSNLRLKLRSFAKEAFTENEKKSILDVTVENKCNPNFPESGDDEDTVDDIYVLSYDEACNPNYGFCEDPQKESKTRQAAITQYAVSDKNVSMSWWLRTPGIQKIATTYVNGYGKVDGKGLFLLNDIPGAYVYLSVRPVLHIDISNADVWRYAGRVTSEDELPVVEKPLPTGTPEPTGEPTIKPTSAPTDIPQSTFAPAPEEKENYTFDVGKLTYRIIEESKKQVSVCNVSKRNYSVKAVKIPGKIIHNNKSYKVTGIDKNVFRKCKGLKKVTIYAKTIKYIGKNAFRSSKKEIVIKIPEKRYKRYRKLINKSISGRSMRNIITMY